MKITAILRQGNVSDVVEITDADRESWTAAVHPEGTPDGYELFVSINDLHCIETTDDQGRKTFQGEPRRDVYYLVVQDRKCLPKK